MKPAEHGIGIIMTGLVAGLVCWWMTPKPTPPPPVQQEEFEVPTPTVRPEPVAAPVIQHEGFVDWGGMKVLIGMGLNEKAAKADVPKSQHIWHSVIVGVEAFNADQAKHLEPIVSDTVSDKVPEPTPDPISTPVIEVAEPKPAPKSRDHASAYARAEKARKALLIVVSMNGCVPCQHVHEKVNTLAQNGMLDAVEICEITYEHDIAIAEALIKRPIGRFPTLILDSHPISKDLNPIVREGDIDSTSIRWLAAQGHTPNRPKL